jgi:amino acid permease
MKGEIFLRNEVKYMSTKQWIIAIIFSLSLFILISVALAGAPDVLDILDLIIDLAIIILFWYIVSCLVEWIYYKLRKKKLK